MNSESRKQKAEWPQIPDFPGDAFKGTAKDYADFRPPYPGKMIDDLCRDIPRDGNARLLDLGCGPGRTTLPFMPFLKEIQGVDPEEEMLEEARLRTPEEFRERVRWIHGTAESLDFTDARFHLIIIGEAFHRMDQRLVATRARKWLVPGGKIAILGYKHVWNYSDGWKQALNDVRARYEEKAPRVEKVQRERSREMTFEQVLEAVGFTGIEQKEYYVDRTWTEDEIVGYLFSVSTLSRARLGGRATSFEKDIRRALRQADSSGIYREKAAFQCLTGM